MGNFLYNAMKCDSQSIQKLYRFIWASMAISLQVLVTPTINGMPLRVSLSDILVPPIVILALALWMRGFRPAPAKELIRAGWGLIGLCLWLGISCLVAIRTTGQIQYWGVQNKLIGFLVLVSYFISAAWLVLAGRRLFVLEFVKWLIAVGWCIAFYSSALCIWYAIGISDYDPYLWRARGFSDNANAYGCLVATLLVLQVAVGRVEGMFPRWLNLAGMTILILAIVFSGSRSAWLGAVGGLCFLAFARRLDLKAISAAAMIAAIAFIPLSDWLPRGIASLLSAVQEGGETQPLSARPLYVQAENNLQVDVGIAHRLELNNQALDLWRTSPIMGVGLGAFLWSQKQLGSAEPALIHTSALWLLTETGLVGLLAFSAFTIFCIVMLWRGRHGDDVASQVTIAVVATLTVAAAASVGTEMIYQRHLWFLLGMGMALCGQQEPRNAAALSSSR